MDVAAMVKSYKDLAQENELLRRELKVAREAAEITSKMVVEQFEQTEQMLRRYREANAQRRAVLDAASRMSIIATDLSGNITLFNPGAENLLGYASSDVAGRMNILSLHTTEDLERHRASLKATLTSSTGMEIFEHYTSLQQHDTGEWQYICSDGTLLPVSLSITSIYNAEGMREGYLFTAMDLTLRKSLEQKLVAAKEEAEQASACRGEFLARMSHEIRTPMNAITGMAYLLGNTDLDHVQQDYVRKIIDSADTLLAIINDILDFSKIDAGRMELEELPFSLQQIIGRMLNVVGARAEEKGLKIQTHIHPGVPDSLVGDALRLGQIILNLCSNAVKFTSQGEVALTVTLQKERQHQVDLLFCVSDTGTGITPEKAEQLFQAFQQADGSITRKYGGSGLGLAICKELTQMMGGEIWVESIPDQGSSFFFTACFRRNEQAEPGPDQDYPDMEAVRGTRVLVAEDNTINQQIIHEYLREAGINATIVDNGKKCLEKLQQSHYDLVLMDIQMPEMDGLEAARNIRAAEITEQGSQDTDRRPQNHSPNPPTPQSPNSSIPQSPNPSIPQSQNSSIPQSQNSSIPQSQNPSIPQSQNSQIPQSPNPGIPIIAMTAHALDTDLEKSLQAGMNDHITKPVHPDTLYRILQRWAPQAARQDSAVGSAGGNSRSIDLQKSSEHLPRIREIDMDEAMQRMNFSPELVMEMLLEFKNTYRSVPSLLRQWQDRGRWEDIQEKTHAIKGASSYIGAVKVHRDASLLEETLKSGQHNKQNISILLQNFLHSLENCLSSLDSLESRSQPESISPSPLGEREQRYAAEILGKLARTLDRGELADENRIRELDGMLRGQGFDGLLNKLLEFISEFDHDAAAEVALKIQQRINGNISDTHGT
ncbi:MAG: response regulator [Desulfonatronospira sp. MSAO_Bac3]|nr:MAG: response regulator [Desulfonatronospira sp. MSAO_Bac3]